MTTVYLALGGSLGNIKTGFSEEPAPAALCSYVYFETFEPLLLDRKYVRSWVLDSGAFTAFMSGKPIKLDDYISFCKRVLEGPRPPEAVFALDVIGDWKASLRNVEAMWKAGIKAIPCFHAGEPGESLKEMARDYPRIAIGGAAGRLFGDKRRLYIEQCFARVWPKKIHGFGITTDNILHAFPFHSVDATSWELGALRYGTWKSYKGMKKGPRTGHYLRPEVDVFLDMEAKLRVRWAKEMKELE